MQSSASCFVVFGLLVAMPTLIQSQLKEESSVNLWKNRPLKNLEILNNGNVIVGSKDRISLFNGSLQEIRQYNTCTPDACDNVNSVMIVNDKDNKLVICGTGKNGKCEVLALPEFEVLIGAKVSAAAISTDRNRPAIAGIPEDGSVMFAVTNGPGASSGNIYHNPSLTYAISKRKLTDLSALSNIRFKEDFLDFTIYYKDVFQHANFSYFVTNQNKKGIRNSPTQMISKVARVCSHDYSELGGYVDFEIGCQDKLGIEYNIIQHVTKIKTSDGKVWIIGVFTHGEDPENLSGHSVVCAATLIDVDDLINKTWDDFVDKNDSLSKEERYLTDSSKSIDSSSLVDRDYKFCKNTIASLSYNIGLRKLNMTFSYRVDSINGLVTAVNQAYLSEEKYPVLLFGTSTGKLIMMNINSDGDTLDISPYFEYPLNSDVPVTAIKQKNDDILYVTTEMKLHKLVSTKCSEFTTCQSTMDGKNPLCGWCVLKNKATRYGPECGTGLNEWLPAIEGNCPSLSPSPSAVAIGSSGSEVNIAVKHIPAADNGDVYQCVFVVTEKPYTISARHEGNNFICSIPSDVKTHTEARLELKMSGFLLGSTSFMFYDCTQYKKCGDCDVQCRWNNVTLTCHSSNSGLIVSKVQCPQLEKNKIFIPSGEKTRISLHGSNLPPTYVYKCFVDRCVDATLSGGNVVCSIELQTNKNKTEKQISVKYRPSSSPDVNCSDMISIDEADENRVIVYNCNELAKEDCSICCALNKTNYKCSWDNNLCAYNSTDQCSDNTKCPAPSITKLDPLDGPSNGGTILTLTGINFGHWNVGMLQNSDLVQIGGQNCKTSGEMQDFNIKGPDEDFTKPFPTRIVCTVKQKYNEAEEKQNVTLRKEELSNQVVFVYKTPEVTEVIPKKGPESGKTLITILGRNLGIGNKRVNIKFNDNVQCTDVKFSYILGENYNISCLTGKKKENSGDKQIVWMKMDTKEEILYRFDDLFEYAPDPTGFDISPNPIKGTLSGGTTLTVKGENLDNAGAITIGSNEYKSMKAVCTRNSSQEAKCPVPKTSDTLRNNIMDSINRSRRKRSTDGDKNCVEIQLYLYLDGVTHPFKISYCRDPELEKFNDGVLLYKSDDKSIKIKGEYLTLAATKEDFKVTIGLDECQIIDVTATEIICNPPEGKQANPVVNVTLGNIHRTVGRLQYENDFKIEFIIAGVAGAVFLFIVLVVVVGCFKRKVGQQAKKYEKDLKNMEMEIINVAREEFLDMHTTMSSVNKNLVEQGFPYHNYQQYACNVMFAVDYLWTEPVVSNGKMTDDERLRANKGMEALESLIFNKFFLVSVIGSLEKQRKFFIREKSNLAGNLCAVLMGRMDYLNEVLRMLMKNLVHDSSGKKAHQKALFRRCESITEKLLSNWMSLCLYPHFKRHSGSPLYLLYMALQKTIEAGPIDAVTGDTKYTLSEEKLLKKFSSSMSEESLKFESKALTLNLVINGGEEIFKCKVLDCDTISQVKSKCLNQIYVNYPASQLDVDPDELILEWHEGFGGSLRLQDRDNTSSKDGSWVRLNTLAHYSVKDESNLALVDPHSADSLQQEDYVNLTQIDMDVGGCNGSMDSTDALTSSEGDNTPDDIQFWHLVKKEEESLKKEKSAIAELYLNRLFTTKLSLKDYIKSMFDIVLDKEHCPPPTKFLLDFLDELGEQFKVDNDTIHGWKSHSYAIRVWAALMKMPSVLFDVQIPTYMDDNLNVISQVFIESFSLSSQKFTKESPSQKLIFHNEMIECRERALEFYKNVKVDTQDQDELRQYLSEVNKLQQQTNFSKTSALYRFYKQMKPYLMDIVEDLATGKETKDLQLDKKLERVMQIMEEEEEVE